MLDSNELEMFQVWGPLMDGAYVIQGSFGRVSLSEGGMVDDDSFFLNYRSS